jgi:2-dehydro-3-deoxyphosphogalactonate aldolase
MTDTIDFASHFAACPLVASLRGIRPSEIDAIGTALMDAGIRLIEIPLNSPEPYESIARLAGLAQGRVLVGAGNVLDAESVGRVAGAGGQFITSPATDAAVIAATRAENLVSIAGFFTATEALTAIAAGAHALKFVPAEAGSPAVLKAMRAILPRDIPLIAVGGMTPDGIAAWRTGGADGFGLGAVLFRSGMAADVVGEAAQRFVAAAAGPSAVKPSAD